jgi:hypothetical protein
LSGTIGIRNISRMPQSPGVFFFHRCAGNCIDHVVV